MSLLKAEGDQVLGDPIPAKVLEDMDQAEEDYIKVGPTSFQCTKCHKRMKKRYNIKVHCRIHKGNAGKHYICQVCDARFVRYQELNGHLKCCKGKNIKKIGRPVGSLKNDEKLNDGNPPNLFEEKLQVDTSDEEDGDQKDSDDNQKDSDTEDTEEVKIISGEETETPSHVLEFCRLRELVLYSSIDAYFNIKTSKITDQRNPLGPITELNIRRLIKSSDDMGEMCTRIRNMPTIQNQLRILKIPEQDLNRLLLEMLNFIKANGLSTPFLLPVDTYQEDSMGSGIGLGVKATQDLPSGKTIFGLVGDCCSVTDAALGFFQKEQVYSIIKIAGKASTQILLGPVQFVNNHCRNFNCKYVYLKTKNQVVLQTVKSVQAGEELFVNYGMKALKCKCCI